MFALSRFSLKMLLWPGGGQIRGQGDHTPTWLLAPLETTMTSWPRPLLPALSYPVPHLKPTTCLGYSSLVSTPFATTQPLFTGQCWAAWGKQGVFQINSLAHRMLLRPREDKRKWNFLSSPKQWFVQFILVEAVELLWKDYAPSANSGEWTPTVLCNKTLIKQYYQSFNPEN